MDQSGSGVTSVTRPALDHSPPDRHADVANAILTLAREIELRLEIDPMVVALPATAREVVRYVHHDHPGATPSQIAAATGLLRPNVSAALRTLEDRGLVERRRDSPDGRSTQVYVTDRARENLERVRTLWSSMLRSALPPQVDPEALTALLGEVAATLTRGRLAEAARVRQP